MNEKVSDLITESQRTRKLRVLNDLEHLTRKDLLEINDEMTRLMLPDLYQHGKASTPIVTSGIVGLKNANRVSTREIFYAVLTALAVLAFFALCGR